VTSVSRSDLQVISESCDSAERGRSGRPGRSGSWRPNSFGSRSQPEASARVSRERRVEWSTAWYTWVPNSSAIVQTRVGTGAQRRPAYGDWWRRVGMLAGWSRIETWLSLCLQFLIPSESYSISWAHDWTNLKFYFLVSARWSRI